MRNLLRSPRWSPYAVGAGIGVLSWITFLFMNKALGVSTTMVRWTGMLTGVFSETAVRENAYFSKYLVGQPAFEWQMALVIALFFGALLAAVLSGTRKAESVPALWAERFGPSKVKRYAVAFLGGFILLFGARLAGGCTSGHGISGGLQLAVSSWTFFLTTFGAGIATAMALYRGGRSHV